MIRPILAVRDSAAGSYHAPFVATSIGTAQRSFGDEVMREAADNAMYRHPADYELFRIGTFDEETGALTSGPHVSVARGLDYQPVR